MTEIRERPILFSSEMVRAILDDRKTETRRVMKPQPSKFVMWLKWVVSKSVPRGYIQGHGYFYALKKDSTWLFKFSYGDVGDILYVRETFMVDEDPRIIHYKADSPDLFYHNLLKSFDAPEYKWKPSIHMPKKFSRIKLKIKEIRVERVKEITETDAEREGLESVKIVNCVPYTSRDQFENLWDSLNKKRGFGWDKDPFVWVIKFERIS